MLMKCPFCGGTAIIEKRTENRGKNMTGNVPEGAELKEIKTDFSGKQIFHWERFGYIVRCLTNNCICKRPSKVYRSKQEAKDAWNHRVIV